MAAFSLTACVSVPGDNLGGYVGIGSGGSRLDIDSGTTDNRFDDDKSVAVKVLGGLDLSSRVGLEAFYADFGEGQLTTGESIGYTAAGIDSVLYLLPGRQRSNSNRRHGLSIFGKLGVAAIDNETEVALVRDNVINFSTGIGAEYGFSGGVGLRASAEALDGDVQNVQLSLLYRFPFGDRSSWRPLTQSPKPLPDSSIEESVDEGDTLIVEATPQSEESSQFAELKLDPLPTVYTPTVVQSPNTTETDGGDNQGAVTGNNAVLPSTQPTQPTQPNGVGSATAPVVTTPVVTATVDNSVEPQVLAPLPPDNRVNTDQVVSDAASNDQELIAENSVMPVKVMGGSDQENIEEDSTSTDAETDGTTAALVPTDSRTPQTNVVAETATSPASNPECQVTQTRLNVDTSGCVTIAGYIDTINFETGGALLTANATKTLDEVVGYLVDNPQTRFSVVTVPAQQADAEFSSFLAKRRTLAVIRYLISQDISGSRLKAGIPDQATLPVEKRDISRSWVVFRPL